MRVSLEHDPRWQKLHDRDWTCSSCREKHCGLFDLARDRPDFWHGPDGNRPNSEVLISGNILTEDFCVLNGEHFFVRCTVRLPIVGAPDDTCFGYGVWAALSKKNFDIYVAAFDSGNPGGLGPWFGWFSNRVAGYPDTLNLKCQLHPQGGRQRPHVDLEQIDHPLAREQRNGITFDRQLVS